MSFKSFELKDIGKITIYKKRSNKSLKISVGQDNEIKISLPIWTPYAVGLNFARANKDWITKNLTYSDKTISDGQQIGKTFRLKIVSISTDKKLRSRIKDQNVFIYLPENQNLNSSFNQEKVETIIKRALKLESSSIIKQRLDFISSQTNLDYKSLKIKELKRRWGSCDSNGHITINLYLIQLPWDLIDYVLLHELVHTKHMSHGREFWDLLELLNPNTKKFRKAIKDYKPVIYNQFDYN
jgi:predicted metal-dependent hydrolase